MAKGINIPVHGDTRPLQREIARATKRPIKLGGLDDRAFRQPLGRIKGQMGEFQKSLEASNARVIAFGASAGAIMAIQYAFKSLVTTVVTVEKKLAEVNVILGTNQKNLNRFGSELFSIAKKTEQSFDSVATAATELARQGLGLELTLRRTKDAMILTRLAGTSVVDSVESITAALNGFNKAALNSTKVINKIIAVDQAFAVSGKDLAEALKRVGSTAQDAGVSLDQLMAVVTTAQQITARGGAVIGNSFKTIFTRIQRPKVIEALQAVGVATKDLTGNSLSAIKVLQNLAAQFDRLSQSQRSQVAELVGGVFQINVLKAALSDLGKSYSIYDRALKTSLSSADEAQRRNALLNKTLAASANELVVNLQKVGASVGKLSIEPVLRRVLGGVNKALNTLDVGESSSVGSKIGEGIFKGIGSFLKGPGLALAVLGIFKLFEKLRVFASDAFKTMTGLNQTQTRQAEIQKNISQYLQNNPKLLTQIKKGTLSIEQVHEKILIKIKQETKEMQDQARIAGRISGALYSRGVRTKGQDAGSDEGRLHVKSQGHIPNFSKTDQIASAVEIASASYAKPSTKVIKSKQPGLGTYYRNSEETITRVPGYKQHFVNPPSNSSEGRKHKVNSIKKTGINPYSSSGKVPNFAKTGVYDSDLIAGGGMSKQAKQVLSTIISSGKRVNSVWGPSGSGKTTWAKGKFGGVPVTDPKQVGDYQDFVVLYGGNQSRKGGLTAQGQQVMGASAKSGGQIFALVPKGGNMEIKNRRENRAGTGSGDLRTDSQIKNTKRAPLWDYGFLSQVKKQYPNLQVVRNQEGHVPSFAQKTQRKLLHLTPETFEGKPYTITDSGYSVTDNSDKTSKGYLAVKGMSASILGNLIANQGYSSDGNDLGPNPGYLKTIKKQLGKSEAVETPVDRKELLSLVSSKKFGISHAPSNIFASDSRAGSSEERRVKSQLNIGSNIDLFEGYPVPVGKYKKGGETRDKFGSAGNIDIPETTAFDTSTQARELNRLINDHTRGRLPLGKVITEFQQFAKASDPDVLKLKKGFGFEDFINLTRDINKDLKRDSAVLDFFPYELGGLPSMTKDVMGLNQNVGYGDAKLNSNQQNAIGLAQKWFRNKTKGMNVTHGDWNKWLLDIISNKTTVNDAFRGDTKPDQQLALLHSTKGKNGPDSVSLTLSNLTHGAGGTDFKQRFSGLFDAGTNSKNKPSLVVPEKLKGQSFRFDYMNDAVDIPTDITSYVDSLVKTPNGSNKVEKLEEQYVAKMKSMVAANTAAKTKSQGFTPNFVDPLAVAEGAAIAGTGATMTYAFLRSTIGDKFNPLGVKKRKGSKRMSKLVDGAFDVAQTDLGNLGSLPNKIQRMLAIALPNSKISSPKLSESEIEHRQKSRYMAQGFAPNFVDPLAVAEGAAIAGTGASMTYAFLRSTIGDKFNPLGVKKRKGSKRMSKLVDGAFDVAQTDLGNLGSLPNKIQRMLAIALPNSKISSPKLSESEIEHRQKSRYMAQGFAPNFVKYQTGQKLPKGRGAGGRHLAVRDQNMGVHWDPKAMFHADVVKRSGLQGKTMDGGWLFPNGRYEKIKGHDGSGLQANGFVPNFARLATKNKKWNKKEDRSGYGATDGQRKGGRIESEGGFLTYEELGKSLDIEYNKSTKKGAGYAQFHGLVQEARSVSKPIKSGTLVNQLEGKIGERDRLADMSPFSAIAKEAYPQLRHRIGENLQTSGRFGIDLASKPFSKRALSFKFKSLRQLESKTNRLGKQDVADAIVDYGGISVGSLTTETNKSRGIFTRDDSRLKVSGGHIPNFASGLEGAIKREHSAGIPMKDIRVGTDPALKTSSNPQGTGVWNVAQENSLQQGMSFAKQAGINPKTKGAFGGHVPNFETEGGAKFYEIGTKNMSEKQLREGEKFQDSVFKASFAFGTLTSVIGGFISDSASAQAATSKATDALTNAGTAVQLIPGPAGKLAGGIVLAAGAMSVIATSAHSIADDIIKENARLKGVTQSASDNLAKYGESFSSYVEEIAKGSTDARRINDLQRKMLASLGEIPAQYRSQLMSSRNLTDVQEKIAKAQSEMSKRSMQVNTGATVATEMDKQLGMGDVFGRNQKDAFLGLGMDDDVFKGGKGGALLGQFNIDLVRTLDMEGLSKHADQLGAAFSFSSMKSQDFINSLRTQHGLTGEVAGIMEEMSDAEIKKVASALEESVRQNARARREFEALNVVLKDNARATNAIKEATQRSTAALRTFITSGLESLKSSRGRSFQSGADKRGLMLERAKGGVSLAEGVLTKDLKLALDTQIKTLERQEKYYASSEKIMDEGRTKLAEAIRKITEIQPKSKGGSGQMAGKELSPEMAGLQRGLMGILRQTENSGLAETRKAFDDFVKSNKQAFAGKNYESESIAILKSQASKLLELKAEQVQANRIAEIQTTVQKKLLQAQRDSATGGGIEKFLEGSKKSFDDRVKFVEKLSKFAGFAEAGLDKETSRSGLNLNKEIRDFLGGLNVNDPALRGMAIKGRSQDIRDESGFRIKQIMSLIPRMIAQGRPDAAASLRTQALALQGVRNRSGAIATRQVDEEVKTRSLPTEIANLVSEIKVLNREQASLDTKLGSSLQQAIVQTQMPDLLNKIQESAVKINDSIILQGKQEEKSAAKAELSTSKVRLGEAQSSLKGTRDSLGRLFENVSIDIDGPLDKIKLGGEAEVKGFIGNIEDFVKQATKMGVISDGQGLDALARTGTVDLEDVWGNLDQGVRDGLTQSGGFGGRLTPTDGTDIRQVFQGLVKDQTGFGQKLNQIAMDISTIETIKPTVNELQQNLSDASAAVAQFKNDIARNRPIESSRGKASTQFGEATSKLRGAIKERDSVRAARGTFGGITQGLQRGDIRGAQSAVANLATGVQSGTISRGEMERQLTSIAQSTGADAGQLIRQVDAVTNSRQGPDRQQAGGRLASTLTGMARRGFSGGQSAQYFQGMGDREQGASAQISSKVSDLQSAASSFDAKLKQQFTKNYWNSPALNMLQPNKLTKADADKQSEIQPDWDTLVRLGKATKISAGFGKNAYVRQSAQVQGLIGGLLRNPTSAGLGNAEKLFGEIQNTSRLKSFQQAAVGYERDNKKYLFAGHVPNFEMGMAKSMGAGSDVKAHMGDGTIGGKRFMMNNYETEIARPGNDSFVIPSYAGGHVPNFASSAAWLPTIEDHARRQGINLSGMKPPRDIRLPESTGVVAPREKYAPTLPDEWRSTGGTPTQQPWQRGWQPKTDAPAPVEDTRLRPRSELDYVRQGRVSPADNPFIGRSRVWMNLDQARDNVDEVMGELQDLADRGGGQTMLSRTQDGTSSIIQRGGGPVSVQRMDIFSNRPDSNLSSLGYNDLMKKLGLRKGGGGGPDMAMEFLDDELMERLGRLNDMFPGKNTGDDLLDQIRKNLQSGGRSPNAAYTEHTGSVDDGSFQRTSIPAHDSTTAQMIKTNDSLAKTLGPDGMKKLESMSKNLKKDTTLRNYIAGLLEKGDLEKANSFINEYEVPDKYAVKKPLKQKFSDWLAEKKKGRAEKKKGRADKASTKNQAKLNKAYGELGTDELAKLFMPPKKGAMDRLAAFSPKKALDAFLPFAPPPSSRIGPWNDWVKMSRASGGAKGPLRDLLTSFHAGKNPLNFANNVINKGMPFDDFISEDVTEKKLAKAKKKASLGTDGKPPKETPKSSAIKDRIKAGLKRSGAVVDAIRNFGATPEGAIEEVLEEIAEPEMGGKRGEKGVNKPYDPTGGKTGPEGTPKGGAKDKANKKGKPGRTRAWLKNKAAPRLQGWHNKVSDLEGRWIKHTRSHPNQYKGKGSFQLPDDARFKGVRTMGKELGVGVLATMLINKVAGGNVPDYDRKLATSKYTGEFLGLGFKTSPDPVGVLDVLMDHFPGIGTGKMGAGDISGQGLLKDAVSMFLPPPASLVMMSLEEMHRQWFQTLDLVQRTKEDIHKSDNKGFKMFADSKIKTQKQGTSDITNLNLFKNQLASLNSVHPFKGGEKFPAGVRWNGMDKWPTSGGSHGLGQRVTGYLPALKKNAGLNNVASRQSQRQNFANKWIEAITIDKKKGIYRLDNEEASSFDFLNLNKYMGRTVQYGNINELQMGKGGGFRYPKMEKKQIAYGGELDGDNLQRTPMDPISSRSKLSIRGRGKGARFDYKSPANGGMFGLYPTRAARKKIGVSKSTTDKFKLMAKTFPYEELSKYFNRQGNANVAAGNAVPPAQRAPQMSELLTGGNVAMAKSAWWTANGANALAGVGNAAPPAPGGAWDSKNIKQLMMNIPLTRAIPAVTWGNTGDALPIGLSNALNKPHWNNPPISNRDLGGLARYARAQYREHKDSEQSDWRRANNTARYQPKNDVDRGIANRKIKKQKNAASWMYKLALDQVKPNPRNRIGEGPARVNNNLDPHHALHPNLDPLLFNTLAGNAVSNKYRPLHDELNLPGGAFQRRRTAMSGNAAGTPIGYHMKELFNAGHNGHFDPVALLQMSRAHGIIDRVRTSSDATVSSRPSQGIKFPNAQDLVSGWGSATQGLRENQLMGDLFLRAPANFRKEAGGNNSELFQFFQNKGRFDKLVHFGGHVPSFANNLETLGAKMQGARNPKAMTGPGTINNKKYVANTEETIIPSKVFSQMGIPTKNGDDAVLRNYGSGATQDRKALASSIPNFAFSSYRNRVRGDHFGGIRGNTNTRTEGTRNYRGGDRLNNVKLFGTSMRDFAFSGMGASAQRDQNRRFRGGNNIRQADINTIISRTRETGNVNLGGFGGMYTPGYGNFDPKIEYSSGNPSGALKGHERFHAVFDQAEVDSFFGQSAMNFQSKDMAGSMKSRFDLSKLFDTGSAYNYGGNIRGGSLPDTLSGINEMLAYSMMGKGRAGADKFAEGKMDARLRGTALRGLTRFNDRDAVKGFGGAAKLAGGGDFFDGMMMFEELASKKYVNRGHIPNFNLVGSALARERSAMPSGSRAMTGFDPRLRGGIGVFNSSEGSLGDAIDMHRAAGKSMSQIQNAGSAGYNSGHIPNFAEGAIADSLSSLAQQQGAGGAGTGNFDGAEIVNLLSEMVNGIGGLSSVVSTGFETQVGAFTEGQQNVNIGGSLPVNVTLGGTVQDASAAIVGQLQTKVNAFMNKALTPAQQGEVNAMSRFGDRQG